MMANFFRDKRATCLEKATRETVGLKVGAPGKTTGFQPTLEDFIGTWTLANHKDIFGWEA